MCTFDVCILCILFMFSMYLIHVLYACILCMYSRHIVHEWKDGTDEAISALLFVLDQMSGFFTLRACPPTHLHAPYLYVPCILAPCPASAMRMLTPWVGGTKGPKGGAPGGQGAARGRTRAARAHGRTRALRAQGPFGPLGPMGTAYTQQKRCQTE